jgi:Undecaprenyl-phosphate glucose phosphotransferase
MSSSSPVPNLGIISGATGSASPLRQRVEEIEDQARSLVSTLQGDSELALAGAAADAISINNVIELDAPQVRRVGSPVLARPRINPRAVALVVHLADALVIAAVGAVAYRLQPGFHWPIDPTVAFTALAMLAMLVRVPNAEPRLLHDSLRRPLSRRLADASLRTLLPFIGGVAVVLALVPAANGLQATLTQWLALWAMGAAAGVAGVRVCLSASIASWRAEGRLKEAVAIFGTGDLAERLLARLQASPPDAVELVGVFDDRARRRIASPGLRSLSLGTADDLIALSRHRDIDRVVVALPHAAEERVTQVLNKLRQMPVEISLAPDLVGFNVRCREADGLAGLPLIEVYGRPLTFGQVLLKSAIDKTLAALMLLVGAPLLLALAAAIKLDSRGPVLFRQNRYGFGDRVIGVYKFRTMCAEASDHNGVVCHQGPNDPRVTRVGHFLRRWSLDELPQLINVLRGEMSLVGPRPHAISMQVEDRANHDIVPDYALRHHMKPGITGWAQVNGYHGPVATEEALRARVRYDLEYINNWSLWFDLQILARTVTTVLGQRHAF